VADLKITTGFNGSGDRSEAAEGGSIDGERWGRDDLKEIEQWGPQDARHHNMRVGTKSGKRERARN